MQERTDKRSATDIFKMLLPSLTVLIVFSCVLLGKGIFPFGTDTIDYYDMGQINAPLYYHAWDWLHGRSALFFDWYINEGQNIAMAASNQWNLSPFILFFLLVLRYPDVLSTRGAKRVKSWPLLCDFTYQPLAYFDYLTGGFSIIQFPSTGAPRNLRSE